MATWRELWFHAGDIVVPGVEGVCMCAFAGEMSEVGGIS
jgi:hypothetical protein